MINSAAASMQLFFHPLLDNWIDIDGPKKRFTDWFKIRFLHV